PSVAGSHTATLNVASDGATTVTRALSGTATNISTNVETNTASTLGLYAFNGKIKFNTVAGEKVQIFNSLGQTVVNQLSVDGLNEISLPNAKGVLVVKVGNKTTKVVL
ncbi:MAG: DUF6383 domain-containing protein, partial [Paludibacteraceae bacterium]